MKTMLLSASACAGLSLAGLSALALPVSSPAENPFLRRVGSSDGGSLPGLPGGRGGQPGRPDSRHSAADDAPDAQLTSYCIALLRNNGQASAPKDLRPSDCAAYFTDLDRDFHRSGRSGRSGDGRDGASISGGQGGQGGRSGAGPGGGRGGAGGTGSSGGSGGRGGAGGSSD